MTALVQMRAERGRFLDTLESLTDEEFDHGRTLCSAWAPRDVLAHVIGSENLGAYVTGLVRINRVNGQLVAAARSRSRHDLLADGRRWAAATSLVARTSAAFLIGDVSVHHQDVLRGLGRTRELPRAVEGAIFREGIVLQTFTNRRLMSHRLLPTTPGGLRIGRGREVRGASEALGLWLAGREGVEAELEFGQS